MASHRYWRIYCRANNGYSPPYTGIAEIEMRESIGGSDATGSGTASASTAFSGLPASGAFDNGSGEWATNGSALPQWIKYDFGAGNDKDIAEITLKCRNPASQMVTDFDLQWSDDDSAWTTLFSVDDETGWTAGETRTYSASSGPTVGAAANQAWRINATAVDGGSALAIAEVQWLNSSATDLATGGAAYASTTYDATFAASKAFDDNNATQWATASAITSGTIAYKFASAVTPATLAIKARGDGGHNQSPKNFTIQYWDGSAWQTWATLTNITGWTSGQIRYFTQAGEVGSPVVAARRPVVFVCT